MNQFLSILNIVVYGILFISAINSFFIKKNVNLEMEGKLANATIISALVVVLLPVFAGLANLLF